MNTLESKKYFRTRIPFSILIIALLLFLALSPVIQAQIVSQGPLSDDFQGSVLNTTLWTFINPLDDGSYNLTGTQLELTAPTDAIHDIWTNGRTVPRLMQVVSDTDFELEVKFDSAITAGEDYQSQGILIDGFSDDFLHLEFQASRNKIMIYAASFTAGSQNKLISKPIDIGAPNYLRIKRVGDSWDVVFSSDGISWKLGGKFKCSLSVEAVGIYVGSGVNEAHTAIVDYFYETSTPIIPNVPPTASFSATPTSGDAPLLVTFDAGGSSDSDGTIASYDWDFGDGNVGTGVNPTHTYTTAGTYTATLTVTDDADATDTASTTIEVTVPNAGPVIDIWYGPLQYFGHIGIPQRWINILGNVSDTDGVASLFYSLNGSPQLPLSIGRDGKRLAFEGDFNVEIDWAELFEGLNYIELTATDNLNNTTIESVMVNFSADNIWPTTYSIAWDSVIEISDVIQVVDGKWNLVPEGVRTVEAAYDRTLAVGDLIWDDYEITIPITVHASYQSGVGSGVGIIPRWTGHTDDPIVCVQPHCGWQPSGAIAWYDVQNNGPLKLAIQQDPSITLDFDIRYLWKLRVETDDRGINVYYLKVWEDGTIEPESWNLTQAINRSGVSNGSILLVAHSVDLTFGDITITPAN